MDFDNLLYYSSQKTLIKIQSKLMTSADLVPKCMFLMTFGLKFSLNTLFPHQ